MNVMPARETVICTEDKGSGVEFGGASGKGGADDFGVASQGIRNGWGNREDWGFCKTTSVPQRATPMMSRTRKPRIGCRLLGRAGAGEGTVVGGGKTGGGGGAAAAGGGAGRAGADDLSAPSIPLDAAQAHTTHEPMSGLYPDSQTKSARITGSCFVAVRLRNTATF